MNAEPSRGGEMGVDAEMDGAEPRGCGTHSTRRGEAGSRSAEEQADLLPP